MGSGGHENNQNALDDPPRVGGEAAYEWLSGFPVCRVAYEETMEEEEYTE